MNIQPTLPITLKLDVPQTSQQQPDIAAQSTSAKADEHVDVAISRIAEAVEPFDVALKFSKDPETGTIVIEMISQKTGETLQQIPNEAMLHVSAVLGKLQGLIFNRKA